MSKKDINEYDIWQWLPEPQSRWQLVQFPDCSTTSSLPPQSMPFSSSRVSRARTLQKGQRIIKMFCNGFKILMQAKLAPSRKAALDAAAEEANHRKRRDELLASLNELSPTEDAYSDGLPALSERDSDDDDVVIHPRFDAANFPRS